MNASLSLFKLLSGRERIGALGLLLLVLVGSLLEVVSLGAIVPALLSIVSDEGMGDIPFVSTLSSQFFESDSAFALSLIGIFIAKNVVLVTTTFLQSMFAAHLIGRFTENLYHRYLRQPYEFHLVNNSADLIRKVQTAGVIWTNGLGAWVTLSADVLVALGLLALMLLQEPLGTLVAISAFGFAGAGAFWITRGPLERWGGLRHENEARLLRSAQHGLGSVREAKVLSLEGALESELSGFSRSSQRLVARAVTAQGMPRAIVEVAGVVTLVAVLSVLRASGASVGETIVTLGLFAAVSFRVIPSVNRIVGSVQALAFGRSQISVIRNDLALVASASSLVDLALKEIKSVQLEAVSYKYPTASSESLTDVHLMIKRGESIGVVGPSGSGKSSLLDIVLGLLHPTSGSVKINGNEVDSRQERWTSHFGYVPQSVFLFDDSIAKNVSLGRGPDGEKSGRIRDALAAAALLDFVDQLPLGLETQIGERGVRLSGGQRQRLGIARAIYSDPDILILDEATSSLDVETEREVMRAIEALKGLKTMIIVTHRESTIKACDRIYRMEKGIISELRSSSDLPQA
jgi:ATP-binding cassette, subfamily B, bacterial PglK